MEDRALKGANDAGFTSEKVTRTVDLAQSYHEFLHYFSSVCPPGWYNPDTQKGTEGTGVKYSKVLVESTTKRKEKKGEIENTYIVGSTHICQLQM